MSLSFGLRLIDWLKAFRKRTATETSCQLVKIIQLYCNGNYICLYLGANIISEIFESLLPALQLQLLLNLAGGRFSFSL